MTARARARRARRQRRRRASRCSGPTPPRDAAQAATFAAWPPAPVRVARAHVVAAGERLLEPHDHVEHQISERRDLHWHNRPMDGDDKLGRARSFLIGGVVGASAALATARRRRDGRAPPARAAVSPGGACSIRGGAVLPRARRGGGAGGSLTPARSLPDAEARTVWAVSARADGFPDREPQTDAATVQPDADLRVPLPRGAHVRALPVDDCACARGVRRVRRRRRSSSCSTRSRSTTRARASTRPTTARAARPRRRTTAATRGSPRPATRRSRATRAEEERREARVGLGTRSPRAKTDG